MNNPEKLRVEKYKALYQRLPYEDQVDVETIARALRNILASGRLAFLAFGFVAAEISEKMTDKDWKP